MSTGLATEPRVAKRNARPPKVIPPELPFERIEFQAPVGFTKRLDTARQKRGLSRSAYIRQAVLLLMQEDEGK